MNSEATANKNELEVLQLLERANLTQYFKEFLAHGADDLQQLLGLLNEPEEFEELVKLVGMDKKPMHMRRFRKALQASKIPSNLLTFLRPLNMQVPEMNLNPFQKLLLEISKRIPTQPTVTVTTKPTIISTNDCCSSTPAPIPCSSINPWSNVLRTMMHQSTESEHAHMQNGINVPANSRCMSTGPIANYQVENNATQRFNSDTESHINSDRSTTVTEYGDASSQIFVPSRIKIPRLDNSDSLPTCVPDAYDALFNIRPSAFLLKSDVDKLTMALDAMIVYLPTFPMRVLTGKNEAERELQELLKLPNNDARRIEGFKRHSTIFARFDSPKRLARPLRHFEICVNELTQQLVLRAPELITQREHLFHIARHIVNLTNYGMKVTDSGHIDWVIMEPYTTGKGTSRSNTPNCSGPENSTDLDTDMVEDECELNAKSLEKLKALKKNMQELVDREETLRTQLRHFKKATPEQSKAKIKREIEQIVSNLNECFGQTASNVAIYHSTLKPSRD